MAAPPLVLCYSFSTPPTPAPHMLVEITRRYEDEFTLLDQVAVTELSEDQRERVRGIVCTGGFGQNKIRVGKEIIDMLPNLKVICTPSTGVNHIDVEVATAHGIRVGHSPGHFPSDSVAEFAFGLLLASARSIVLGEKIARTTDMKIRRDLTELISPTQQVTGSTLGIVGMGNIGKALAEKANGFKMNILYHSRTRKEGQEKHLGLTFCPDLKKLLEESDFVVLCLPLTDQTRHLISSQELSLMKPTAHLINVGRGGTVNHNDLTAALQNGVISGAALDVTEPIKLPEDHPLLSMPNVIITPHIATYAETTLKKMYSATLDNLKAGVKGQQLLYSVN